MEGTPSAMSADREYSQRRRVGAGVRRWKLVAGLLEWTGDGPPGRISLAQVNRLRIAYEPTRISSGRFVIWLRSPTGSVRLDNLDWAGVGQCREQDEAFMGFTQEMLYRIQSENPAAECRLGKPAGTYVLSLLFTVFLLVILFGAGLFFLFIGVIWLALLKVLILLVYLPRLIRYLKRNRPRKMENVQTVWQDIGMKR